MVCADAISISQRIDQGWRRVARSVVDQDDLLVERDRLDNRHDLAQRPFFVVNGYQDRE